MIIMVQLLCALAIERVAGFRYGVPIFDLARVAVMLTIFCLGSVIFGRAIMLLAAGKDDPFKRLWSERQRAADLPLLVVLVTAQLAILGWLKVAMPVAVGFWADPLLADVDAALFGRDAWRLLPPAIGPLIDWTYVTWGFASALTLTYLAVAPAAPARGRAIASYFLLIAVSALGQYAFPSAGPIFYQTVGHGDRFAAMEIHPWVRMTADYLWQNHAAQGGHVGAGISAMPSVHVGGAAWIALTLGALAPRLRVCGWAYFALIFVGSVYLGWHYAIDGIAGLILAVGAWMIAPLLLRDDAPAIDGVPLQRGAS
jgi:hypothetical protein